MNGMREARVSAGTSGADAQTRTRNDSIATRFAAMDIGHAKRARGRSSRALLEPGVPPVHPRNAERASARRSPIRSHFSSNRVIPR